MSFDTSGISDTLFWYKWIAANSSAELVGLGTVAALGYGIVVSLGEPQGAFAIVFAAILTALGALEGVVVGIAQAWLLKQRLGQLKGWVQATVIGAAFAWLLGMIPSTLMNLSPSESAPPPQEPNLFAQLFFASILGLITGPVLAFFQWRTLHHYIEHKSGWWMTANAAAWALGMPVIFIGIDTSSAASGLLARAITIGVTLLLAGAIVGAVHGRVLVSILKANDT